MATTTVSEWSSETFHTEWSADHPIAWSPADSREPDRYLSKADAIARLTRYGWRKAAATEEIESGRTVHTGFASYRLLTAAAVLA